MFHKKRQQQPLSRRGAIRDLTAALTGIVLAGRTEQIAADSGEEKATGSVNEDSEEPGTAVDDPQPGWPTLGGMQFWGDIRYFCGFKIQRNVFSGHYRLLGADNRRFYSGTLEECDAVADKLRKSRQLTPDTGHAVIYLHGIGRSSRSLQPIIKAMPQAGFIHVPFEYPSTRVSLEQSASYLHSVIESLTDVEKISFVVHSMGGLVVRQYLRNHRDPRLHRMVMLGTPNNGAELADMLKSTVLFRAIYGPAGQELSTDPHGTIGALPIPDFEFGIIAGGKGDDSGFNRLLPGDDDSTVTVASARLREAADFLLVNRLHSFLMSDNTVLAAVPFFLEHGRFLPDRPAQPIE